MTRDDTSDTAATVARHIRAVLSGDVEATLQNFVEESVVITPDGVVKGLSAIRRDTEAFFTTAPPEMIRAIQIVRQDAEGEIGYLLWKAEPFVTLAAETFLVRDGKIRVQTFAVLGGEASAT